MTEQLTETFWKPEPKEPWHDWRTYSMLIPILSGATGACIFFALGLAFAEVINIGPEWRKWLVLTASFTVAFGSTFGSVGSGIEVFRKVHKKQVNGWDWTTLAISTLATVAGFAMGFAALLGATTDWSREVLIWGSIVVGTLAALDGSGDMIEVGGLFGSYEDRVELWREEREEWRAQTGQKVAALDETLVQVGEMLKPIFEQLVQQMGSLETKLTNLEERRAWPTATAADVTKYTDHLNGDRAKLTREELGVILAEHKLNLPSPSTVKRGLGG